MNNEYKTYTNAYMCSHMLPFLSIRKQTRTRHKRYRLLQQYHSTRRLCLRCRVLDIIAAVLWRRWRMCLERRCWEWNSRCHCPRSLKYRQGHIDCPWHTPTYSSIRTLNSELWTSRAARSITWAPFCVRDKAERSRITFGPDISRHPDTVYGEN